jgi:hypothetical protein
MGLIARDTGFMGAAEMESAEKAAWLDQRCGKCTASRMNDADNFTQKGASSAKRNDYLKETLAERLTGDSAHHYVNAAMQWGLDNEAAAKEEFTKRSGYVIHPTGFIDHPIIENFGATPDGFILRGDGKIGVEIKCPTTATYIEWMTSGGIPEEHHAQMLAGMACTGWKGWIFVAYDPRIRDVKKQMMIRDFNPPLNEITRIEHAAIRFLNDLDNMFDLFTTS